MISEDERRKKENLDSAVVRLVHDFAVKLKKVQFVDGQKTQQKQIFGIFDGISIHNVL